MTGSNLYRSTCHLCGGEGDILAVRLEDAEAERDRLRAELAEAHTWLEAAGLDDCEHRGSEGTNLCRFAEALRDVR